MLDILAEAMRVEFEFRSVTPAAPVWMSNRYVTNHRLRLVGVHCCVADVCGRKLMVHGLDASRSWIWVAGLGNAKSAVQCQQPLTTTSTLSSLYLDGLKSRGISSALHNKEPINLLKHYVFDPLPSPEHSPVTQTPSK